MISKLYLTVVFFVLTTKLSAQSVDPDLLRSGGCEHGLQDYGEGAAVDALGNLYVTGSFEETAYFGNETVRSEGGADIFIAKYNQSGDLLWVKRAGGAGDDWGYDISVDGMDLYVTGRFNLTANFNTPSNPGSNTIMSAGAEDIFLAKYDLNGNYQWAKRAGGLGFDQGSGVSASNGYAYIAGYFSGVSADFNTPSVGGINEVLSAGGSTDIFLACYDALGNLAWVKRAGGTGDDMGNDIVVSGDTLYITGHFAVTANFNTPSSAGTNELTSGSGTDIFLARYDIAGNFFWARRAGGADFDEGTGVAMNENSVFITGRFGSTANFNTPSAPGSNEIISLGAYDGFVSSFSHNGDYIWAKRFGGSSMDYGYDIAVNSGLVFVTGHFLNTANFNTPSSSSSNTMVSEGGFDVLVASFNTVTGLVGWYKRAGGSEDGATDRGKSIALTSTALYITGHHGSTPNFNTPSVVGKNEVGQEGAGDLFVAKYNLSGNFLWGVGAGGGYAEDIAYTVKTDDVGNIYVAGSYMGISDFEGVQLKNAGATDIFLAKYSPTGSLLWVRRAGGTRDDQALDIELSDSSVYLAGSFGSRANFNTPSDTNSNEIISAGNKDIFLARFDTAGNFIWSKRAGGMGDDWATDLAIDGNRIYITGAFDQTINFNTPSSSGTNEISTAGDYDIFLASFTKSGVFLWANRAGGINEDEGLAVDAVNGKIYLGGYFFGTGNFNSPYAPGSNDLVSAGGPSDIFLACYSDTGNLDWIKRAGGNGQDKMFDLEVLDNSVYTTGSFGSFADFNTPSNSSINFLNGIGGSEIFLARFDTAGVFDWAKRAGGTSNDVSRDLVLSANTIYLSGYFEGTSNFNSPSVMGSNELISAGEYDIFTAAYGMDGSLLWLERGGGVDRDFAYGVNYFSGAVYVVGFVSETANFNTPSTPGLNELISEGTYDISLVRYFECGYNAPPVKLIGATLTAGYVNATYSWLDCNNGMVTIPGENSSTFNPSANGSYALGVTLNGCTDTSDCINVTEVGMAEHNAKKVTFYPNPTDNYIYLQFEQEVHEIPYRIVSPSGQTVSSGFIDSEFSQISLAHLSGGVYYLTLDEQYPVLRIIRY